MKTLISVLFAAALTIPAFARPASAGLVIDVVKAPRPIPMAVMELVGPGGGEVSKTIIHDLEATGLFAQLDQSLFIERPGQPFDPARWRLAGAEVVLKGFIQSAGQLTATAQLYDVSDGSEVMASEFQAGPGMLRPLAHAISNAIYEKLTNSRGVFKSKIACVTRSKGAYSLVLMDWDGARTFPLGVTAGILLKPRWSRSGTHLIYSAQHGRAWDIERLELATLRTERVFSGPGTNIAGDFTSGTDEFVLSSSRSGSADLFIYNAAKPGLTRLTDDPGIEVSPVVSPDGNSIAYISDRGGSPQVYIVGRDGYNKRRISFETAYTTSPAWSPAGGSLAWVGTVEGKNQIFTAQADGSGVRVLTALGENEDPSFSPDGRFIAFTSTREGGRAVYVMSAGGERQRRISPPGVEAFAPQWSPE